MSSEARWVCVDQPPHGARGVLGPSSLAAARPASAATRLGGHKSVTHSPELLYLLCGMGQDTGKAVLGWEGDAATLNKMMNTWE